MIAVGEDEEIEGTGVGNVVGRRVGFLVGILGDTVGEGLGDVLGLFGEKQGQHSPATQTTT